MKRFAGTVLVVAFLLIKSAICYTGDDAAMVLELRNGKAYYESGKEKAAEVILMDFLQEGERISLRPETILVLNYFLSSVREKITGPGGITIGTSASKGDGGVTVESSKVDGFPSIFRLKREDLQQHAGAVFGSLERTHRDQRWDALSAAGKAKADSDELGLGSTELGKEDREQLGGCCLLGPSPIRRSPMQRRRVTILGPDNTAVRSSKPVFRWQPVEEAESYKLWVADSQGTLWFELITEADFATSPMELPSGERYRWTVSPMVKGQTLKDGREAEGVFSILTEENLEKVSRIERDIEKSFSENSDESLIRLALLYQSYQLCDEAADVWRKLCQRHPQNKNITAWGYCTY